MHKTPEKSKSELKKKLMEEWASIDPHYTQKIVSSMPKKLMEGKDTKLNTKICCCIAKKKFYFSCPNIKLYLILGVDFFWKQIVII